MKKTLLCVFAVCGALSLGAETIKPIPFGDFDQWVTRNIKESDLLGGKVKQVYEIGPTETINEAKAYVRKGGTPWGTSNVYAKVASVVKTSNAVFPDKRGDGYCAKLTTMLEHAKAIGIINIDVLVSGSIFTGLMQEPVSSTKDPYSKMEMGVPFTGRPVALQFDYKATVPGGNRLYCSGFGPKKTLKGQDYAEVFILLQRRWEDEKGGLHAKRVGTGRQRFGQTTTEWQNGYRIPIWYGDITQHEGFQDFMGLLSKENSYYAKNSKGKMVPVVEEGWDDANATPTHAIIMASSGCGTPYTGTVGMVFWIDNMAYVFE